MTHPFIKLHGLGNDFVLLPHCAAITAAQVRAIAHRTQGLGCDQLITLQSPNNAPHITFYNADGSMAGACGNGSRCVAGWWFDQHPQQDTTTVYVTAETDAPATALQAWRASAGHVLIEAGCVRTHTLFDLPNARAAFVNMGNPHVIVHSDDLPTITPQRTALAQHIQARLPHSANVGFMHIDNAQHLTLLTYERGVGFTSACGTNACAAAVVAANGQQNTFNVHMMGGDLTVMVPAHRRQPVRQQGAYTVVASGVLNMAVG